MSSSAKKDAKTLIETEKIKQDNNRLVAAKRAAFQMEDNVPGVVRKVINIKPKSAKIETEKRPEKKVNFNIFRRI